MFFPDASVCLPGECVDKGRDYPCSSPHGDEEDTNKGYPHECNRSADKCHHIRRLLGDASSVFEAGIYEW